MLRPRRANARFGFTLVEVVVSLLLISMLAAVVVPTVRGQLREGYVDSVAQELDDLAAAINAYRQNIGKYPPYLDYLNGLTASPKDLCTNVLTAAQIANYKGPYINRPITAIGYTIGNSFATVSDQLNLNRGTAISGVGGAPTVDYLSIVVDGVDSTTAMDLDKRVDGIADENYGTIRWQNSGTQTKVFYQMQIRKGTC
jgi:prepilin-type N-terminal cleavage/methylation domain-containing protein